MGAARIAERGPQGMGWGQSRRGQREEAGGTKGPCAGSQLWRGSSTGRRGFPGAAMGLMLGESKGHQLTPPGPGQTSHPKSTPPKKPAKAQAVSRVASSGVTRGAEPSRLLREPDFTHPDTKGPF